MGWYKLRKQAELAYGYWIKPTGELLEVPRNVGHAMMAYRVLGGQYPQDVDDYETPYRAQWLRVEGSNTLTGESIPTPQQAKAAANLFTQLRQPSVQLDLPGMVGTVETPNLEGVLSGTEKLQQTGYYQPVAQQGGSDW